jgi:hypothetical protein
LIVDPLDAILRLSTTQLSLHLQQSHQIDTRSQPNTDPPAKFFALLEAQARR